MQALGMVSYRKVFLNPTEKSQIQTFPCFIFSIYEIISGLHHDRNVFRIELKSTSFQSDFIY